MLWTPRAPGQALEGGRFKVSPAGRRHWERERFWWRGKELGQGNMADSREVMNIRQASQYLGVSPDTLYKYVGEQKIPAFKLGNRWRFKKSKLDQWMEEKSSQMESGAKRKPKAASKAAGWGAATAHNRAQVLYYVAENLEARAAEFTERLHAMTGANAREARDEVDASIRRMFFYAGFADKYDGAVHATQKRFVTLAMNEPWGVMGLVCPDEAPLLAFVSLVAPAIAMGNAVVVAPSAAHPLAATDFYSVLDTSDVPAGIVNIVTGEADALAKTLAEHDGVDAMWHAGPAEGAKGVEAASAGNLKATWTLGAGVDWRGAQGREFLRRATQVKNIWTPYGE